MMNNIITVFPSLGGFEWISEGHICIPNNLTIFSDKRVRVRILDYNCIIQQSLLFGMYWSFPGNCGHQVTIGNGHFSWGH